MTPTPRLRCPRCKNVIDAPIGLNPVCPACGFSGPLGRPSTPEPTNAKRKPEAPFIEVSNNDAPSRPSWSLGFGGGESVKIALAAGISILLLTAGVGGAWFFLHERSDSSGKPEEPVQAPKWHKGESWVVESVFLSTTETTYSVLSNYSCGTERCGYILEERGSRDSSFYSVDAATFEEWNTDGSVSSGVPFPLYEGRTLTTTNWSYEVGELSKIRVRAGEFWAYAITAKDLSNDDVTVEKWYSPALGRIIKEKTTVCGDSIGCLDFSSELLAYDF